MRKNGGHGNNSMHPNKGKSPGAFDPKAGRTNIPPARPTPHAKRTKPMG